jgi:uncharacterized membrane protein YgdD (TMEM256/DUF423 family)
MSGAFWVRSGAILAGLGVVAGAFGAHYLKERLHLEPRLLETFETGVRYHLIHALALVAVGLLALAGRGGGLADVAGWLFLAGVLLFSGSIYGLALSLGPARLLGPITPLGGTALIIAWFVLAAAAGRVSAP